MTSAFELAYQIGALLPNRFNQPIGQWSVGAVASTASMFSGAISFNQSLYWDVSSVQDMSGMFKLALDFNGDIRLWDVSSVTKMGRVDPSGPGFTSHGMFEAARAFNQDLLFWDVSHVEDMTAMFRNADVFNQPLADWDVSSVRRMSHSNDLGNEKGKYFTDHDDWKSTGMFSGAKSFNQDISNWNLTSLEDMGELFRDASSFSQDLCSWGVYLYGKDVYAENAFTGTACPNTGDPILDATPPGPFCFNCDGS